MLCKFLCMFVVISSKTSIKSKGLVCSVNTYARFRVLAGLFLEKGVCFPLQADCLHPFEWITCLVVTIATKGEKKSVRTKYNVIAHHGGVHSDQLNGEGIDNNFPLDFNLAAHDFNDP